jgi:hypothetical protein
MTGSANTHAARYSCAPLRRVGYSSGTIVARIWTFTSCFGPVLARRTVCARSLPFLLSVLPGGADLTGHTDKANGTLCSVPVRPLGTVSARSLPRF